MDKVLIFDHIWPRELPAHFGAQPASQETEGGVESPRRVTFEVWEEIVVVQSQHVQDNVPVHIRCGVKLGYIEATTRRSRFLYILRLGL